MPDQVPFMTNQKITAHQLVLTWNLILRLNLWTSEFFIKFKIGICVMNLFIGTQTWQVRKLTYWLMVSWWGREVFEYTGVPEDLDESLEYLEEKRLELEDAISALASSGSDDLERRIKAATRAVLNSFPLMEVAGIKRTGTFPFEKCAWYAKQSRLAKQVYLSQIINLFCCVVEGLFLRRTKKSVLAIFPVDMTDTRTTKNDVFWTKINRSF